MNFKQFWSGLFRGRTARQAGREDTREHVGEYLAGVQEELSAILGERQQSLLGFDGEDVQDAEFEVKADYGGMKRHELMSEAKRRGIAVANTATKADLVQALS